MSAPINEKFLIEAIDRIARTPDGRSLYLFCQKQSMTLSNTNTDSALNRSEGQRMFAARLMELMAKGISESGGRTSSSGSTGGDTEQPVVFTLPEPIPYGGRRGAGSRITADTRVFGYDLPDDGGNAA